MTAATRQSKQTDTQNTKKKKSGLLGRSNHTMCTVKVGQKKLSNGSTITKFISYVFGGLVYNNY